VGRNVNYLHLAAPEPVVLAALRALDRGRPVAIPGLRDRIMAGAVRLLPGWASALVSGRMLRQPERWVTEHTT
jgi:hypothetical protein